jgi:hypothetical protein
MVFYVEKADPMVSSVAPIKCPCVTGRASADVTTCETMGSDNSRTLRREAHPFTWSELTGRQQDAVKAVAELLLDALEALDQRNQRKDKEVEALELDLDRRSQLAFIDGERGMGKTSVLLAVQRLLGKDSIDKDMPDPVQRLYTQRRRFVWLKTLDMEPLSGAANLLAAILVRIGEKLDSPGFRVPSRAAAVFDDLDEHEKTASELQELEMDAVLAWQGTDSRRAEHTDPTVYASEVVRSERAGLRLNPRLRGVLKGLAGLITAAGAAQDPIFVIPIDDFDLAASRCLELLRIIRMVTAPHLFFLVAGNTRIAEIVLRLETEGDLAKLVGRHLVPEEARWLRQTGVEIAANNLRKLLPPEQRARLDEVDAKEALTFRASPESETLDQAVGEIIVVRNNAPTGQDKTSLKSFLLPREEDLNLQYAGAESLGGKPRQILDRILLFKSLKGEHGPDPKKDWGEELLRKLAEDLQRETREHAQLDLEQRDRLLEMLNTSAGVRFSIRGVLKLLVERSYRRPVPFDGGTVWLYEPGRARWVFRNNRDRVSDDLYEPPLPSHLAASITALHDLAISLWGGYVFPNSIHYQPEGYFDPVAVDWSSRTQEPVIQWHVPEWWTIRESDRFLQHWQRHADNLTSVDELAWAWLAAQLEVLMDEPHLPGSPGRSPARVKPLLEKLAQEGPVRFSRKYLRESALVCVALLLAPESGCSKSLANDLLTGNSAFVAAITDELAERVRLWRADSFRLLSRQDRQMDSESMRLLSALSPAEAIRVAQDGLGRFARDETLADFATGSLTTKQIDSLRLQRAGATSQDPRLVQALDVAIVALEERYASHPFNFFREGVFVPQDTDIDRQGSQARQRLRRYP